MKKINFCLFFVLTFLLFIFQVKAYNSWAVSHYAFVSVLIGVVCFFLIIGIVCLQKHDDWNFGSQRDSGEIKFGKKGNALPEYEAIKYFRDIPFEENLAAFYWICLNYDIVLEAKLKKGLMGAIILKWIKEGKVSVVETAKGILDFKDNDYALDLNNLKNISDPVEKSFSELLLKASSENNILEANEFKKWCSYNSSELGDWFYFVKKSGLSSLKEKGYITASTEKVNGRYGSKRTIIVNNVSDKLWYEGLKIKGLKKFLLYFSLINEKEYFDVHLWEKYMIFSSLLNVTQKVQEQFENLYPKINGDSIFDIDTINYGLGIAELGYISYEQECEEEVKQEK